MEDEIITVKPELSISTTLVKETISPTMRKIVCSCEWQLDRNM